MAHLNAALLQAPEPFTHQAVTDVLVAGLIGESADSFGFKALEGGTALDVAAGDGRYNHLLHRLGATNITSVERHQELIDEGMMNGLFIGKVVCADFIDWASKSDERFDLVALMNIPPGDDVLHRPNPLLSAAAKMVGPKGQLLVTAVEAHRGPILAHQIEQDIGKATFRKTWSSQRPLPAHNVLVVGTSE
jgi:2-polyprenyl-3-methyl-5-hydroxy-6-metoxy-1,4-benzoquinol methylase